VVYRPTTEVFDYVADLRNEPEWTPDASNIVKHTDGEVGEGTVFEEDFRRVGHYITTVDVYEPASQLGFDARNPRTDARVRFTFAPKSPNETQIDCTVQLTMKGPMRVLEPLLAPMIRRQIEHSRGPGLKAALEK
jgi:hypothetical protein